MVKEKDFYQFQLSFKGQLVENSVDAFDVANTILATSQALQEIAEIRLGDVASKEIRININAFQRGSLTADFLILLYEHGKDTILPLLPEANSIYKIGKNMLESFKTIIEVKKMLKGSPPIKVQTIDNRHIKIVGKDNSTTIINYYDFRGLQSKTLSRNIEKAIQPLLKEGSLLEKLKITEGEKKKEIISIGKIEANYLQVSEGLQTLDKVKYKGVITKIDTKAYSGYINIAKKRLPFNFDKTIPQEKFNILVESLKQRIQIYLIGRVRMDYENNPIHIQVIDVQPDTTLL